MYGAFPKVANIAITKLGYAAHTSVNVTVHIAVCILTIFMVILVVGVVHLVL